MMKLQQFPLFLLEILRGAAIALQEEEEAEEDQSVIRMRVIMRVKKYMFNITFSLNL